MAEVASSEWDVPAYLQALYGLWAMMGQAQYVLEQAHGEAHILSEDGDTVLTAYLLQPSDPEEWAKAEAGEPFIDPHDLMVTAAAALRMAIRSLHARLEDMQALPAWWGEGYDAVDDRPLTEWEVDYINYLNGKEDY